MRPGLDAEGTELPEEEAEKLIPKPRAGGKKAAAKKAPAKKPAAKRAPRKRAPAKAKAAAEGNGSSPPE